MPAINQTCTGDLIQEPSLDEYSDILLYDGPDKLYDCYYRSGKNGCNPADKRKVNSLASHFDNHRHNYHHVRNQ